MRILMLGLNRTGKGTYWRTWHLARHLARRGHTLTIMTVSPGARRHGHIFQQAGVTVLETPDALWGPLRSGWDLWDSVYRVVWQRRRPFDVIHAFETRPINLLPVLAARQRHVPICFDWCDWFGRGGSVEERPNALVRALLRPIETYCEEHFRAYAQATTVICTTLRDRAIALGAPPGSITLLRDGADLDGLRVLDRDVCRQRLRLAADARIVGYVGSIFPRDARLMAAAFDQLHAREPAARLLLIGYVNIAVERWVKEPSAVLRTGPIAYEQLSDWLGACDVCWLPYHDSGANRGRYPLKLNDYLAAGRSVVATAVGDVAGILRANPIGLLCPPDPEQLADAVRQLFDDADQRRAGGLEARQLAEREFDWAQRAQTLEAVYASIC
jgi:glycosyltransferase involved in cell wall biosynthesis